MLLKAPLLETRNSPASDYDSYLPSSNCLEPEYFSYEEIESGQESVAVDTKKRLNLPNEELCVVACRRRGADQRHQFSARLTPNPTPQHADTKDSDHNAMLTEP